MAMDVPVADASIVFSISNAGANLPKGQFHLTADNAQPGLIVMAYVVADQDDWAVDETPVHSFIAVYSDETSSDGGSGDEDDVIDEDSGEKHDAQEDQSSETEQGGQEDEHDDGDRPVREEVKHLFLRPFVITQVFPEHYNSLRIATHNSKGLCRAAENPDWMENHMALIDDNTSDEEKDTLGWAFSNCVAQLRVRKMYGGATLQQPCTVFLVPSSPRCFEADGAVVVGDLEVESYNYMVERSWEMFAPKPKLLKEG